MDFLLFPYIYYIMNCITIVCRCKEYEDVYFWKAGFSGCDFMSYPL